MATLVSLSTYFRSFHNTTEFTLDSTNVNIATTATTQSVADSMIATPRKKKKKIGAKKLKLLEFTFKFLNFSCF